MRGRLHNRLPRWHRRTIYSLTTLLFVTGALWLAVVYLAAPPGEPTPAPHEWAGPLLAIHGIAAYAALIAYGLVGHAHLRTGWRAPALRSAGTWLCAMIVLLAGTGLGIYYLAAETVIPAVRWTHVAAGVLLPCWLALHIVRGHRYAARTGHSSGGSSGAGRSSQ